MFMYLCGQSRRSVRRSALTLAEIVRPLSPALVHYDHSDVRAAVSRELYSDFPHAKISLMDSDGLADDLRATQRLLEAVKDREPSPHCSCSGTHGNHANVMRRFPEPRYDLWHNIMIERTGWEESRH